MLGNPTLGEWFGFVEFLCDRAVARKADLVVLDTIGKFAPWENENDAAQVQAAMNPLDRLTKAGLAVLPIHHFGKTDGSEGRAARGSTALPGSVDVMLELRRYKANDRHDRRRVLTGFGRFDDIPEEVVIELIAGGDDYTAEGDRRAVADEEATQAILEMLPLTPPGLTAEEVHEALPEAGRPRRSDVMRLLQAGAGRGRWGRSGAGKKGDPWRFHRTEL
jgi:hypothetical protein